MSRARVATYIRLSNEDNDKINKLDYSESIKNQRSLLIDYINSNSDFMLYDEYIPVYLLAYTKVPLWSHL